MAVVQSSAQKQEDIAIHNLNIVIPCGGGITQICNSPFRNAILPPIYSGVSAQGIQMLLMSATNIYLSTIHLD